MEPFHPLGAVSLSQLQLRKGLAGDLSFTPADCVQLYDTIKRVFQEMKDGNLKTNSTCGKFVEEITQVLVSHDPDKYFAGKRSITRDEARKYEDELKQFLRKWTSPSDNDDNNNNNTSHGLYLQLVERILKEMATPLKERLDTMENEGLEDSYGEKFLMENIFQLLFQLKRDGKLPVIVFNFGRKDCNKLATVVYDR